MPPDPHSFASLCMYTILSPNPMWLHPIFVFGCPYNKFASLATQAQPALERITIFLMRNTESDLHWGQLGLAC